MEQHLEGCGNCFTYEALNKSLQGQSYARFVQDLGMNREEQGEPNVEVEANGGGGQGRAAIRALVAGSLLMTQASGSTVEESENVGKDWVFTVGDILMIVGAVYAGQLVVEASKCCLRRMRCPPEVDVLRDLQGLQNRGRYDQQGLQNRGRYGQQELQSRGRYDQDIVVVSEDEMAAPERETMSRRRETRSGFEASSQRSTSLPMTTRSGCDVSGSGPMGASSLERKPPSGSGASMSQRSPSQSGTAGTFSMRSVVFVQKNDKTVGLAQWWQELFIHEYHNTLGPAGGL